MFEWTKGELDGVSELWDVCGVSLWASVSQGEQFRPIRSSLGLLEDLLANNSCSSQLLQRAKDDWNLVRWTSTNSYCNFDEPEEEEMIISRTFFTKSYYLRKKFVWLINSDYGAENGSVIINYLSSRRHYMCSIIKGILKDSILLAKYFLPPEATIALHLNPSPALGNFQLMPNFTAADWKHLLASLKPNNLVDYFCWALIAVIIETKIW